MGTFGGAGAAALSDLIPLAFANTSDGTLPAQKDNDQPTVETILKQRMQESEGWGAANEAGFAGLPGGLPMVAGIIAKLAEQITGLDVSNWIEMWDELPVVGNLDNVISDAFGTIFTQSSNLLSLFQDVNFLDPDFNVEDALTAFVELGLMPLNLVVALVDGLIPDWNIGGLDASKIVSGEFPMEMITGLLEAIADAFGVGDLLGWFGLDPGGDESDLQDYLGGLLGSDSPLNALNLFNIGGIFGNTPIGNLTTEAQELLDNPDFREAISLQGGGIWIWDDTDGYEVVGCANVVANSQLRQLMSNAVAVSEGDEIDASVRAKWSGLTYTGTAPIKLQIVELYYDNITGTFSTMGFHDVYAAATPAASQTSWLLLNGADYTVPVGVTHIALQLHVGANATAGTVKFDKGSLKKIGKIQMPWVNDLPESLTDLFDGAQATLDMLFEGITGFGQVGTLLEDVMAALRNIPFANVIGIGGPASIGESMQSTWDQWISGLVGSIGTGAGLADLFNIGQDISGRATLGQWSWDILGTRNNKSLKTGFHPTSQSTVALDALALGNATLPTVAVTQSTALTGYERISESISVGMVSWQGSGTTNITDCYINIYKMNTTTGVNTLVHASTNQVGLLSATLAPVVYSLPTPVQFEPTEIIGIEVCVRGSGTHNVAGSVSGLPDQAVYPRRFSSRRNSGTSAAPATFTPVYAADVPMFEYGVSASEVAIPHTPSITPFTTAGTRSTPIPSWANYVDVVVIGGGGGGHQGGTWGIGGEGGECGPWTWTTWARGTHFTGTAVSVSSTTGNGGSANSGNGQASSASIPGYSLTGPGGPGANNFDVAGSEHSGDSPGNFNWPGGGPAWPIAGAAAQSSYGARGNTPGGGGGGGNWVSFQPGGPGGVGGVFIRFRQ